MIEVHNLCKRFGKVQALAGASFTARDGIITALLGPNGAGKTTLLRTWSACCSATTAPSPSTASIPPSIRWRYGATSAC